MARIDLSTAGVSVSYAVETTAGTRPTTGYTKLTGIKSIPDLNPEPSSLETTTFDEVAWRTYIPGLKDPGGAIAFGANNTEQFQTEWSTMVAAAESAQDDGKSMWFVIAIPGLTNAFYLAGIPSDLGLSAMEVDNVAEVEGYVTPTKIEGWQTAPTA